MIVDQSILEELTARAKASPRLRMNMDLRNSPEDQSQRMLNAIEPGPWIPCPSAPGKLRAGGLHPWTFQEFFFDASDSLTNVIDLYLGGPVITISSGQWYSLRSMESGRCFGLHE